MYNYVHCISNLDYIEIHVYMFYFCYIFNIFEYTVTSEFKHNLSGRCQQWDVNNEMLHGGTYERLSGDPDITMDMFRQMHTAEAHPLLFLNEYGVISYSESTVVIFLLDFRN